MVSKVPPKPIQEIVQKRDQDVQQTNAPSVGPEAAYDGWVITRKQQHEVEKGEVPTPDSAPASEPQTRQPPVHANGLISSPGTPLRFPSTGALVDHALTPYAPPPMAHVAETTPAGDMIEDDRIITRGGSRYFPIILAAEHGQVPRTTLLNWINAKIEFQGRPLQTYDSPTARKLFVSEESVDRVAHRFVKWPSQEPAGEVHLGETKNKSGYVAIAKAARVIGVDHHTMWLWSKQGKTSTDKPIDVIKCRASEQFYIHEKDVSELKKLVPRSGLRRGRRSQLSKSTEPVMS